MGSLRWHHHGEKSGISFPVSWETNEQSTISGTGVETNQARTQLL